MLQEQEILSYAADLSDETIRYYHELHRIPELLYDTVETNRYLRKELSKLGIEFHAPLDNVTVAVVHGKGDGPCIGLRCDTDALPVEEETGLPYASEHPGVMHACGHDAHMAIGLTAARILHANRASWNGTVKVIFQPAEEGGDGAVLVMSTGLVDDVDQFFGLHVWSPYASGFCHISPIVVSAAVDMFTLRVIGRGGHGATPEKCADAVVAASAVVGALQQIVSRNLSPMDSAILTIGSFHAGSAGNVIAQEAELKGTLRALNEKVRVRIEEQLENVARCTAMAYGCTIELKNHRVSDVVENDPDAARIARECASALVGEDRVMPQKSMMLGDDFANYSRIAPGCYVQVGIADEAKGTCAAHHNGHFQVDEDVLPLCTAWMVSCAVRFAEEKRR